VTAARPSVFAWPVVLAGLALTASAWALARLMVMQSGGVWIYALDDAYIHMATGRTMAMHGIWGVSPDGFAGATTSLAWPWLLAITTWVGGSEWWPFALNVAAGAGALVIAHETLARQTPDRLWQAVVLLALVVSPSLAALAVVGMEHSLQVLVTLWLAAAGVRAVSAPVEAPIPRVTLFLLAMAAVAARYDTAAVVAAVMIVAAARRRWSIVGVLAAGALLPPVMYAIVASGHDWPLLPTSVLVKSGMREWEGLTWPGVLDKLFRGALAILRRADHFLVLVLSAFACLVRGGDPAVIRWREAQAGLAVFLLTLWLHLTVGAGSAPKAFRYDAFVLALGVVMVGSAAAAQVRVRTAAIAAMAIVVLHALVGHGVMTSRVALVDARYQFTTTHQLATVLTTFDTGPMPAVQDLGETSYRLGRGVLDLDALGTLQTYRAWRDRGLTAEAFSALARTTGTRLAIVIPSRDDGYVERPMPATWRRVAEWHVDGHPELAFFAADPEMAARLDGALRAFDIRLPAAVTRVNR
jgi:hypothetical protein